MTASPRKAGSSTFQSPFPSIYSRLVSSDGQNSVFSPSSSWRYKPSDEAAFMMSQQSQQPLKNSMSSSPSPATIPSVHSQQASSDLLRKLQETTIAALRTSSNKMDSNYGGSSKGTSPDTKGKGQEQRAVFDGLFPRIETRGQSKVSSKNGSGRKKEGKSSH